MRGDESAWPSWATEAIDIVDADPRWRVWGENDCDALEGLLAPWLVARVEHVGSTAVPGLAANPIIDLQAAVGLDDLESTASALVSDGWHDVDPALDQRPWRRFFVNVTAGRRSAHLHVMKPGTPRWNQQIAFRDALLCDASLAAEYATLKRALVNQYATDREAYTAGKADFIHAVITVD